MFLFPFTSLHEINLDWILDKVKTLVANNEEFNTKADYAVETADEAKEIAEQAAQATIADGAVTTAKIADGAVTTVKLANTSVTSTKIQSNAVQNTHIADGAVTSAKIADGTIATADIANGAVTTAKLDSGAVTTAKLDSEAVTAAKIAFASDSNTLTAGTNITINQQAHTALGKMQFYFIYFTTSAAISAGDYVINGLEVTNLPNGFAYATGGNHYATTNVWSFRADNANGAGSIAALDAIPTNTQIRLTLVYTTA